jgi:hypothetical protein
MAWLLLAASGCSSKENDSLAREKASVDQERKALAEHKAEPLPAPAERGPLPTPVKPGAADGTRLPAGTLVKIVTTQYLSTRSALTGQEWTGKLTEDLKDEKGKVLAKAGSDIKGRVVLVSDGTNLRRKHEIEIRVHQIQSASGRPVEIRTTSFIREGADGGSKPAIVENQMKIEFQLASSVVFP